MFKDLPEGQTNSFQAQVLAVWPDATCGLNAQTGLYEVWDQVSISRNVLGTGYTEAEAWQNAFEKLPKNK